MIYRFGEYEVNDANFEILRSGKSLDTQPQVFELLVFLLQNRARFVTRDEIFNAVWKDRVVSDSTLSGYIKMARKLVGDDGKEQNVIRTVHGRGFQFVADVEAVEPTPAVAAAEPLLAAPRPNTHYTKSGNVHIAYQLFGSGAVDLVLVPGFISHIDNYWDNPQMAAWLNALGKVARVVMFDKRGTGLSDTVYPLPDFDVRMDDVGAVMDAVSLEKAFIMGISEGGSLATLFAAMHPGRCQGLVLYGAFSSFYYWFKTRQDLQGLFDYIESSWGSGESLPLFAPSVGDNTEFKDWWGKFERLGATPGAAIALMTMNSEIDITDILPTINTPALVIHRRDDVLIDIEGGQLLAEHIPNAHYVELAGPDHLPWVGNSDEIVAAIADFVEGSTAPMVPDTILTTLLAVDIDGNDETQSPPGLIDDARSAVQKTMSRFRGQPVNKHHPQLMGTFDGPARAVHCACEIIEKLKPFSLRTRCCVHTGEVYARDCEISGSTLERIEHISSLAPWDQATLSETVKDLIAGAGLSIKPADHAEPGAALGDLRLFSATRADA